ncbi:MAG TPA: dienelactone hydrolase family protein [Thermoanaerobaculia bacterium]|nr:dienelactone hydrolase family protein [Thermoanaerobaculia bacterium]
MNDPHRDQPVLAAGRPLAEAGAAMVLVHGRGASAESILELGRALRRPDFAYLAPQARRGTWYPNSFLAPLEENEPWLSSALGKVGAVLEEAGERGPGLERTILLGFSQGACLALEYAARNPARYGAVVGLTGGLQGPPGRRFDFSGDFAGTPVLLAAGDPDPHVPWWRVEETAEVFRSLGAEVTLRHYPGMPHTVNQEELTLVRELMARVVGDAGRA